MSSAWILAVKQELSSQSYLIKYNNDIILLCIENTHNPSISGSIEISEKFKVQGGQCIQKNTLTFLWGALIVHSQNFPPPWCI